MIRRLGAIMGRRHPSFWGWGGSPCKETLLHNKYSGVLTFQAQNDLIPTYSLATFHRFHAAEVTRERSCNPASHLLGIAPSP